MHFIVGACPTVLGMRSLYLYFLYMKLVPQNNHVLCRCITPDEKTTESGFTYKSDDLPVYEVISVSSQRGGSSLELKPGDKIVSSSTGTKAEVDGEVYYMFSIDTVMGKTI